jgi:hypothetical protein
MAKALVLSEESLATPPQQPRAARPRAEPETRPAKPPTLPKAPHVPLQIRIPAADAKDIKRAALEADQTISEFMLACYHVRMTNDAMREARGGKLPRLKDVDALAKDLNASN